MKPKDFVLDFYKSDALIDSSLIENYIHKDILLDWHSSKGFMQMNYQAIFELSQELGKAYIRSKVKISNIIEDGNFVSVCYSHYIKTVENPREEMLLAHFMVLWEIKESKLYRGYQMSQLSL